VVHPVATLILSAGLALALGSGVFRLTRDPRPDAFIPTGYAALTDKQRVDDFFGLTEPVVVGVIREAPGGIFHPPTLKLIRDLTDAIKKLPQVEPAEVLSLATESGVYFENGEPGFELLMKMVPTNAAGCEALKRDVLSYELYTGTLVAADGSAACIVIQLRDERRAEDVYRALRELLDTFPAGDEQRIVAGEAAVRAHMGNAVSDDALRMNFIAPVVMVLVLVLTYRTLRGTVLPLSVIGAASALALGLMGFSGVPVYIVTNGIFVIIMALGVCYSLHVLGQYYEEQIHLQGRTRQAVIVDACMLLWYPVLMTSLTDFTGFLSLYSPGGMPPIGHFGLFTAAGVLGALLFTYTFLPAGLAVLPLQMSRVFAQRNQPGALDAVSASLNWWGRFVFRRRVMVLGVSGAGLVILGWGASKLVVNDARILAFKDHHPLVQAARALNARFDGTSQLNLVVTGAGRGALLPPEALRKIEALEAFTETLPHVGGTHSVVGWIKRAHQKLHEDKPEFYAIPNDPEDIKYYLDTLGAPTCPMSCQLRQVIDPSYAVANLIVRMRSSEFIHQRAVIQALERYLAAHFTDSSLQVQFAGRVNLDYHWLRMIRSSHIQSVISSAACSLLLTALMFRSLVGGLICTLIVGVVVLFDYAVMGFAGIPLGVGTSMFASIAIGTGVDFPIHLLDRLRHGLNKPETDAEAVFASALAFTGRALFFSAAVVATGLLLLCVSQFRTLVEFGLLIGLAMIASFIVSVTLLPALVAVFRPRFVWGRSAG
jgi:hypothetical protein